MDDEQKQPFDAAIHIAQLWATQQVHFAALCALAQTHPQPARLEHAFRQIAELALAEDDDDPPRASSREAFLDEVNAFLEAIRANKAHGKENPKPADDS